jgi:sulfoxide reductase heme-binding subunit YedZ
MGELTLGLALVHRFVLASTPAESSPLLWYVTRTLGVSAYVALTFSVILGMLRSIARSSGERLSWVVDELHQFVATLAGLLVAGHLVALYFDPFLPFTLQNLLLPIDEPYRPLAVQVGVFALYAMAVALVSSWLRRRMRYGFWRALHYISFIAFALVTAHGWLAGSDTGEPWMRGIYVGSTFAVGFLTLMRLVSRKPSASAQASAQTSAQTSTQVR